jgi:hypothetical protein
MCHEQTEDQLNSMTLCKNPAILGFSSALLGVSWQVSPPFRALVPQLFNEVTDVITFSEALNLQPRYILVIQAGVLIDIIVKSKWN